MKNINIINRELSWWEAYLVLFAMTGIVQLLFSILFDLFGWEFVREPIFLIYSVLIFCFFYEHLGIDLSLLLPNSVLILLFLIGIALFALQAWAITYLFYFVYKLVRKK
jgi:hypothetical protein